MEGPSSNERLPWEWHYALSAVEIVFEEPEHRILLASMDVDQEVPWHSHDRVFDHFIVLDGTLCVEVEGSEERKLIDTGRSFAIDPQVAHRISVAGTSPCRFINAQIGGPYNFRPMSPPVTAELSESDS